jgi:hypothetical protein
MLLFSFLLWQYILDNHKQTHEETINHSLLRNVLYEIHFLHFVNKEYHSTYSTNPTKIRCSVQQFLFRHSIFPPDCAPFVITKQKKRVHISITTEEQECHITYSCKLEFYWKRKVQGYEERNKERHCTDIA